VRAINNVGLGLLALVFASGLACAQNPAELDSDGLTCPGCSVVFLNIDLLRADFVGLLNEKALATPNIDRFFANAIKFTDVSASSGVTAISNTATQMGRDGFFTYSLLKNTYVDNPPQMPFKYKDLFASIPTIAETLKGAGYETLNVNHGYYAGKQMLLNRGFDVYWGTGEVDSPTNIPADAIRKTADLIKARRNDTRSYFFLMRSEDLRGLPYRFPDNRPHFEDPRIDYRRVSQGYFDVVFQLRPDGQPTVEFPSFARADWMSKDQLAEYEQLSKKLYLQQLQFVDEELGQVFSELESSGRLQNTIVVLYANHGDGLYDNRIPNHGVSYQSCISVPLLIRHPRVKQPIVVREAIALIDLVPTIYQMLSLAPRAKMDGIGLLDVIQARQRYPRKVLFGVDKESQYVRNGDMKLIVWADRVKELYDIRADPREIRNIATEHPELVLQMEELLSEHEIDSLDHAIQILLKDRRKSVADRSTKE